MKFFGVLLIIIGTVVLYWFAIKGRTLAELESTFSTTTKNLHIAPVSPTSSGPSNVIQIAKGGGGGGGGGGVRVTP